MRTSLLLSCLILLVAACNLRKKADPSEAVNTFLTSFQEQLQSDDDNVYSLFDVSQSHEAMGTLLDILRNKDADVVTRISFNATEIEEQNDTIRLFIPVDIRLASATEYETENSTTLFLYLTKRGNDFVVTKLDGQPVYEMFSKVKNSETYEERREKAIAARQPLYDEAALLRQKFDTVVWFTHHQDKPYYYVCKGRWSQYMPDFRNVSGMGLCDADGNLLVPTEYQLVGSFGFYPGDIVEVMSGGQVGLYDVAGGKELVAPTYDFIIPIYGQGVTAITKLGTQYGWLNAQYAYQDGFPSDKLERFVKNFEFLKSKVNLKAGEQEFCEVPSPEQAGIGSIMPPSYLTYYRMFSTIEEGISTETEHYFYGGMTDYSTTLGAELTRVTASISALVSSISTRYLDGREEFYNHKTLWLVNSDADTLSYINLYSSSEVNVRQIDSTMLEISSLDQDQGMMDVDQFVPDTPCRTYEYIALNGPSSVSRLPLKRGFNQTYYAKIDSSYLTGRFSTFNPQTQAMETTEFLSVVSVQTMRDEILASYGQRFPEEGKEAYMQSRVPGYTPQYDKRADYEDQLSDIDKHNLAFLDKVLALMGQPSI